MHNNDEQFIKQASKMHNNDEQFIKQASKMHDNDEQFIKQASKMHDNDEQFIKQADIVTCVWQHSLRHWLDMNVFYFGLKLNDTIKQKLWSILTVVGLQL